MDLLTLSSNSVDDIGIYDLQMNIVQDENEPTHGFTQPYRGTVATISYDFQVTVNPCLINSFTG